MNEMPPYEQEQEELLPVDLPRGNQRAAQNPGAVRQWLRGITLGVAVALGSVGVETSGPLQAASPEAGKDGTSGAERAKAFKNAVAMSTTGMYSKYASLSVQTIMKGAAEEKDLVLRIALYDIAMARVAWASASAIDIVAMNEAFAGMQRAGEESNGRFTARDALASKADIFRRIGGDPVALHKIGEKKRMTIAIDIIETCIEQAIEAEDLALAKELVALAQKYVTGISISASSPKERSEKSAKLTQLRKELMEMKERLPKFQQLFDWYQKELGPDGKPQTPSAHHTTAIWKLSIGRPWRSEVLPHLAQSNFPELAKAARMEMNTPETATADKTFACVEAWMEAGRSDKGSNKWEWYAQAGRMLHRARQQGPEGGTLLDIEAAAAELRRMGVEVGPGKDEQERKQEERKAAQPEEAFPKGKWVDIPASSIDPKAAYRGEITVKNNVITTNGRTRFVLPIKIENGASYEVSYRFMRTRGNDTVGMSIPVGKNRVAVLISTGNGRYSGIDNIDGKNGEKNRTAFSGKLLNDRSYELRILVLTKGERASISVYLNDRLCAMWGGSSASLSEELDHACNVPGALSLSANEDKTIFARIKIRRIEIDSQKKEK